MEPEIWYCIFPPEGDEHGGRVCGRTPVDAFNAFGVLDLGEWVSEWEAKGWTMRRIRVTEE